MKIRVHSAVATVVLTAVFSPGVARAQASALLTVESTPPGADVTVDGTAAGATPLVALPLGPGRHRVGVTLTGQAPVVRELDLEPGQALTLHPVLVAQAAVAVLTPPPKAQNSQPRERWLRVPAVTWVAGGVAAALFGVGLGEGIAAGNIDHRAGLDVSPSGVDLGLTRTTAVAGRNDAIVGNVLMIGAGVVALIGLGFAAFEPEAPGASAKEAQAP